MSTAWRRQNGITAISTALKISEILEIILKHLYDSDDDDNGNGYSVANAARACKSFRDVALPILWRRPPGFLPLLELLPRSSWQPDHGQTRVLPVQIPPRYIVRFQYYAQFVKELCWALTDDHELFVNGIPITFFLQLKRNNLLFPTLRSIEWFSHRPALFPIITFLLGPCVEKIRIGFYTGHFSELLGLLGTHCPSLRHLDFTPVVEHAPILPVTLPLIAFQSMDLCLFNSTIRVHPEGILTLGTMSRLTHAAILTTSQLLTNLSFSAGVTYFPSLQALRFVVDILDDASLAILESIGSPSLQDVSLAVQEEPTAYMLHGHLRNVARHAQLVKFRYEAVDMTDGHDEVYEVTLSTVQPLLKLLSLRSIYASVPRLNVDSALIDALVKAIPKLVVLELINETNPSPLHILLPIAEGFPDLHKLTLSIDAGVVPALPENWRSNSALQQLGVFSSTVIEFTSIATYLRAVFPSLYDLDHEYIDVDEPAPPELDAGWEDAALTLEDSDVVPQDEAGLPVYFSEWYSESPAHLLSH